MLGLLLLQVLASCLWLVHNEVVKSFADCPDFFYEGTPPNDVLNPQNPAYICQCYSSSYHYATLYNRTGRIPVYSAYIYQPGSGDTYNSWFVEPQLVNNNTLKEMETESLLIDEYNFTLEQIKASQAVTDDYKKLIGLDRGCLNPSGHQESRESKTTTFTLTNVVPLDSSLYTGQWKVYESQIMREKTKGCKTTYVITGAVPGNRSVADGRINRPSHIWSAACCVGVTGPNRAWGVIAENDKNQVKNHTLGQLEAWLTGQYEKATITLFHSDCPRE